MKEMRYTENMKAEKALNDYLEYLEIERGRVPRTIENYRRYITTLLTWGSVNNIQEINETLVRKFRMYLNRDRKLNKHTQNYYLIALRGFLIFCAKKNIQTLAADKIELAHTTSRELNLITPTELQRLLNTTKGSSLIALRDKAIMEVLFSTGMRVSELCNLNREKLEHSKEELSIKGKGGKIRVVFLSKRAQETLGEYLAKRRDIEPALFPLTPRSIQRIIARRGTQAGITKKLTPHVLRHVFATDLLQAGADMRSVQTLLGHANIATTQIYTHVTNPQLKKIHQSFHGKSRN